MLRRLLFPAAILLSWSGGLLAATLTGQITGSDGSPVPGVQVIVFTGGGALLGTVVTSPGGFYTYTSSQALEKVNRDSAYLWFDCGLHVWLNGSSWLGLRVRMEG